MKAVQILMWNKESSRALNGYLYNGYVIQSSNFPPTDWAIPTFAETELLGTGGEIKEAGTTHWTTPNTGATNSTGFTFLPSGYRGQNGTFLNIETNGYMAIYPYYGINEGDARSCSYFSSSLALLAGDLLTNALDGLSVRFIYTGAGTPSTVNDYDGNIYDVVKIGTEYWTKQNWKCTHLNDGTSISNITSSVTWIAATAGDYYMCAYDNDDDYI